MPDLHGRIDEAASICGGLSSGRNPANNHNLLYNRDLTGQHPIGAITGLMEALAARFDDAYVEDGYLILCKGDETERLGPFSGGSAILAMRVDGGYIQYTTDGETWVNLVAIADLKGDKGDKGDTGAQGIQGIPGIPGSPGADGRDGVDGRDGADGEDGYTPVRGVDYWTAADIATIKGYVDDAILGGEW